MSDKARRRVEKQLRGLLAQLEEVRVTGEKRNAVAQARLDAAAAAVTRTAICDDILILDKNGALRIQTPEDYAEWLLSKTA